MHRNPGRKSLRTPPLLVLLCLTVIAGRAEAIDGRLIVLLDGELSAPIPPTLSVDGPGLEESRLLDAVALASREILFEGIEPGIYRIAIAGTGGPGADTPTAVEAGVHEGLTTVVRAQIGTGVVTIDPFRPDPFGADDAWSMDWIGSLPGDGEAGPAAARTSPTVTSQASLDRLDLAGTGFRGAASVEGASLVHSIRDPIGIVASSQEKAARRLLSRSDASYAWVEGAAGDRGRRFYEGSIARDFTKLAWKPRVLVSLRGLDLKDAAPSAFSSGDPLPHNDLQGLEVYGRVDAMPGSATRLTAQLYGDGSQRNHFVEAFRRDTSHSPREDRASIEGALRAVREIGSRLQIVGEVGLQRTYVATGDGRYFDNVLGYSSSEGSSNPGADEDDLYWLGDDPESRGDEGHRYNYFRRNVQVDWTGKLEAWREAGTARAAGAGILLRRGTYRSYENLDPMGVNPASLGSTPTIQAIGYDVLGESHSDAKGREPGHPQTFAGFATARRPLPGAGEVEAGVRATIFRSGQQPVRNLADPFGGDQILDPGDLGAKNTCASIDPRVAYTRPLGLRGRLWLSGGGETRTPPSEALYFSPIYLESQAYGDPNRPVQMILGNPDLEPERAWLGMAAVGVKPDRSLSFRLGAMGSRIGNAITPRAFPVGSDSLAFYVNDGRRELIDLFARAEWTPSENFTARASYDLSRARTTTVEPEILDAGWAAADLPPLALDQREGFVRSYPVLDDGSDRGYFPSIHDRRHRISIALVARPRSDFLGEAGVAIFKRFEASALFRAASGRPFTSTYIKAAGLLPPESPSTAAAGHDPNDGRLPWTGQLDLRVAKAFPFLANELQLWLEVVNVTDQENTIRVYQATGEGDQDGWLDSRDGRQEVSIRGDGFANAYSDRIQDPTNYGEPRLLRAGLRLALP